MQRAAKSTPSAHALLVRVVLCALVTGVPASLSAQNLGSFKGAPLSMFTQEDRDLLSKKLNEVLESEEPNASQEWENPKSGNSGSVSVRSQFTATDGASCKRLRVTNNVKKGSVTSKTMQTLCKYEGRGWLLHPDAEPAPATQK